MTENQCKEELSRACVQAIAAANGVSCSAPSIDDDSVDLQLSKTGRAGPLDLFRSPTVWLQLKATTHPRVVGKAHHLRLSRKNYDDLRDIRSPIPRLLILAVVDSETLEWVTPTQSGLLVAASLYWTSLFGLATIAQRTATVTIPLSNAFTPESMRGIMDRVARGESLWGER